MRLAHAAALAAAVALVPACGGGDGSDSAGRGGFDGERAFDDVRAQVAIGPRPAGSAASREEVELIVDELRAAGVRDVGVQRPHLNVVGRVPGSAPGAVVVGAHHDTLDLPGFVGTNDGASGVAVVLELARSLPARLDGPSLHLALFDAEEARGDRPFELDGTRGSRQYVRYAAGGGPARQGSPPFERVRAMVLFDLVGDCELQIPREAGSDRGLYERFAAASKAADGDPEPFSGETGAILDDHVPFLRRRIPAVNLIDFSFGPGSSPGDFWHTGEDTLDKVCASSLDAVGEAALRAILRIGAGQ